MDTIKRVKAGDILTADLWNRVLAKIEPFAKLSVPTSGYLRLTEHPNGKSLSMAIPKPVMARLSGSTSPYSWTAVMEASGGTFTDRTAGMTGGTSNVYEVNGKAGLSGKVVPITWTAAGDWRFQWIGVSANFAWTFNVRGCNSTAIAGATIELHQSGVLIDSCVTGDGTGGTTLGQCILTVPAGTYDITITGPSGSGLAASVTSDSIGGAKTTTRTLTADSDHVCVGCCNFPLPKTLYTSDALGTHTLTWDGFFAWRGSTTYTTGVMTNCVAGGTMTVRYIFLNTCVLQVQWRYRCCPAVVGLNQDWRYASDTSASAFNVGAQAGQTSASCSPVSIVCNVPAVAPTPTVNACDTSGGGVTAGLVNPGGGGLMTVTA